MKIKFQGLAAVLASATLLSACGGGGSASTANTVPPAPPAPVQGLYLLAGQITGPGNLDGSGKDAHFGNLGGVAADAYGNLFVTDTDFATVRKIDGNGMVTTLAGSVGNFGTTDGDQTTARFKALGDIGVDLAGNVYVTDGSTIRRITQNGQVSTIAGRADQAGYLDGSADQALLEAPYALAVAGSGDLYFSEMRSHNIRKVTSAGVVSTYAGQVGGKCVQGRYGLVCDIQDGPAAQAYFSNPSALALDAAGSLYVADLWKVRKVSTSGMVSTLSDQFATAPIFSAPAVSGMAVDANGNAYTIDQSHGGTILKIVPNGSYSPVLPALGNGSYNYTRLTAIGNGFLSVIAKSVVQRVDPDGTIRPLAGSVARDDAQDGKGAAASFSSALPYSATRDAAGNLYVVQGSAIRKLSTDGEVSTLATTFVRADGSSGEVPFQFLSGVVADTKGNLYVSDDTTVRKVTPAGTVSVVAGIPYKAGDTDGIGGAASFSYLNGICLDSSGNLLVTTRTGIRKIGPDLRVSTLAGSASANPIDAATGSADGVGTQARFNQPQGIVADAAGNVYVADRDNHTIRKISPAGVVTTLAGVAGERGATDGMGSAARFHQPTGLGIDQAGNLFVSDTGNHTVRRISPDGRVSTVLGQAGKMGVRLGNLPATLSAPSAIVVAPQGIIYVSSASAILKAQL